MGPGALLSGGLALDPWLPSYGPSVPCMEGPSFFSVLLFRNEIQRQGYRPAQRGTTGLRALRLRPLA
jgi:hypothetical protein